MNDTQLAKRQERAATEALVIQQVEDGFRVYAADEPKNRYIVSGPPNAPQCTCPDFQYHRNDPDWHCKHILAVLKEFSDIEVVAQGTDPVEAEERRAIREEGKKPRRLRATTAGNGHGKQEHGATLTLKRSVSPDGRIDSLSVEFSTRVDQLGLSDTRTRAEEMLQLQAGIISQFLERNGRNNGTATRSAQAAPNSQRAVAQPVASGTESPAVPARLVSVAGMDGKWGRRLFINVEVNGRTLRLFGNKKQLAEFITSAGFPDLAENIAEGVNLNLPCRVTTKPSNDGRFTDIDQVLPLDMPRPQPQRTVRS